MAYRDLRRVEQMARRLNVARAEFWVAILRAREVGESFDDIAGAAGVSTQKVQEIAEEHALSKER